VDTKRDFSAYYTGKSGIAYFEWQDQQGQLGAEINLRKFAAVVSPTDVVLDFGCGGGWLLKKLTAREKIGIEVNPAARQRAIENGIQCWESLERVKDSSVDVVISNHALEHTLNPVDVMTMIRHKLRPGGTVHIVTPFDDWRSAASFRSPDIHRHLFTWTPQLMGNLLVQAGFSAETVTSRIVSEAWPPGWQWMHATLPSVLCRRIFHLWAILANRRQVVGHAVKV
jgi:SAM-dependent methyltransferase